MKWKSELYQDKHDFVAEYGKSLLDYLPKEKNKSILDLGCGTGTLTYELAKTFPDVLGADGSLDMIERARRNYPELRFEVNDALNMNYSQKWDIVFSNAVFHWISDHDQLLLNIKQSLKPSGQLICEFGGFENISTIEKAFMSVLEEKNYQYESPFNFSTEEAFRHNLEKNGFIIDELTLYDRPTVLKDNEKGLYNWATQFFESDLSQFSQFEQEEILTQLQEKVRDDLWNGHHWFADYKRLRAIAHLE